MRVQDLLALSALGGALLALPVGCGAHDDGDAASSACPPSAPVSYASCVDGTYHDGSCPDGGCAFGDLPNRAYAAWRAKTLALSGLGEEELSERVAVSTVHVDGGPIVRVEYVIVLDWVRSRQADSIDFTKASSPATDAEIAQAVDLAIAADEWTGLGAIASVVPEPAVEGALDGCACDIALDWCGIGFTRAGGRLRARGIKELDAASGECLEAAVDVATGELLSCELAPCAAE